MDDNLNVHTFCLFPTRTLDSGHPICDQGQGAVISSQSPFIGSI